MPTWFCYAFLRRLAALEAVISMPTRPVPVLESVAARRRAATTATWPAGEPIRRPG